MDGHMDQPDSSGIHGTCCSNDVLSLAADMHGEEEQQKSLPLIAATDCTWGSYWINLATKCCQGQLGQRSL